MKKLQLPILAALSFLIPGLVMLAVLYRMGFYPFGETSLLIMDMDGQYVRFYEYLRQLVIGDGPAVGNLFFSWAKTFGSNFTGLFAYYLSSPLSALMLLFDDAQAGVFWLTLLKISLCGLSSLFYFRYTHGCKGPAALLFTTSYALMSYNVVYAMCLMWLDGAIWLPVVLLGTEKILRGGRPYLLIAAAAMALMSNYYTGYMVCLFGVLYALYRYFSAPRPERAIRVPRALGLFSASYAAALGLALWLLLPTFLDMQSGKIGYTGYVPDQTANFPLPMYALSFLRGTYTSITNSGVPALYCGLLTGALCLAYAFAPRVKARAKLLTGAFFLLLLGSFYFLEADMAWHIFQYPNWFPYRYAFVFQFLAVSVACAGWQATAGRWKRKKMPLMMAMALLPLVCFDLYGNARALLTGLDSQFHYQPARVHAAFQAETGPLIDVIHASDSGFYRIEKTYARSLNDALGMGHKGITHYSSMFHSDVLTVTRGLGMAQSYFWNGYVGSTPVTDALFSVKYVLSKTELPYTPRWERGGVTVYENPYVLPSAFMTDAALDVPLGADCFAAQNALLRALGGTDVFQPVETGALDGLTYRFTVENDRPVYAYFPGSRASLSVNGTLVTARYYPTDNNNAAYLGRFAPGAEVAVSFDGAAPERGAYVYTLDMDALAEVTARLREGGLTGVTHTASGLSGEVRAERDGFLFVSVPYDRSWTVKVDGRKATPEPALDAFMAVPVNRGDHHVRLSFRPRGLAAGAAVSLIVLAGLGWTRVNCV